MSENCEGNSTKLITEEDLFKVLKKRHHLKLSSVPVGNKIIRGVFYETVCMLENLEHALEKIHSGAYPAREEFSNAQSKQDKEKIIRFYRSLCVDQKLLEYAQGIYSFSERIQAFIKYLRKNENPFLKAEEIWDQSNFPKDLIFDFIEKYVLVLEKVAKEADLNSLEHSDTLAKDLDLFGTTESDELNVTDGLAKNENTKNDIHKLTLAIYKSFHNAVQDFRTVLDKHKQLYVLCFDIGLLPQEERIEKNLDALGKKRLSVQSFIHDLDSHYGLTRVYSRLEIGINHRLNHHVILLFKVNKNSVIDPRKIKAELEVIMENRMAADDYWQTQDFEIRIKEFWDVIASFDPKFPKTNIIKAGSSLARQKFEYGILGYFFLVDLYLRPDLSFITDSPYIDQHSFQGVVIENIELPEDQIASENSKARESKTDKQRGESFERLKAYDQDKSLKKIKNLPKPVKQQLEQITSLYSEYATLFNWEEGHLEFLFLIEYLMRFIQYNYIEAFTGPYVSSNVIKNNPDKYLSYVAKLFVAAYQMIDEGSLDIRGLQQNGMVGWRVKAFFEFFNKELRFTNQAYLLDSLPSYLKKCKTQVISSNGVGQPLYKREKAESHNVSKNSSEAKKYLRTMIKADVFALCFKFSYVQAKSFTKQRAIEAFNLIFTDFLKNLKRTKKLSEAKLIAHLGTRFFQDNKLYVDATFIFDAQELLEDDLENEKMIQKVEDNIINHWEKYLSIKQQKISVLDKKNFVNKSEKTQMDQPRNAIQAIDKLTIQALPNGFPQPIKYHDKEALRAFMDKTISFYTAHALLCTWELTLKSLVDPENEEKTKLLNIEQFLKGRIIVPQKKSSKKVKSGQDVEAIEDLSSDDDTGSNSLADPNLNSQNQIGSNSKKEIKEKEKVLTMEERLAQATPETLEARRQKAIEDRRASLLVWI